MTPLYQRIFADTLRLKLVTLCLVSSQELSQMAAIPKISILAGLCLFFGLVNLPNALAANDPPEAKQVDAVFADLVKPGSPGCALAIARGGKIVYAKGYGLANLEQEVPIT